MLGTSLKLATLAGYNCSNTPTWDDPPSAVGGSHPENVAMLGEAQSMSSYTSSNFQ